MPSARLSPKIARLLGLQLFAVVLALVAVLAFVLWNTRPNRPAPAFTGGIDVINVTIAWIAFIVVIGALIYIHVNFARQLLDEAKGKRRGVESW